jgi:transcriptional regulator of arginine metabolism
VKAKRHAVILKLVREHSIPNQERLRELLVKEGEDVTQATLSRDIRELGLVKSADDDGVQVYAPAEEMLPAPHLTSLVPSLLLRQDAVGTFLVLRTPTGSASALTAALDHEAWPEVIGSIAGDDTVLLICKTASDRQKVGRRIAELAQRQ